MSHCDGNHVFHCTCDSPASIRAHDACVNCLNTWDTAAKLNSTWVKRGRPNAPFSAAEKNLAARLVFRAGMGLRDIRNAYGFNSKVSGTLFCYRRDF